MTLRLQFDADPALRLSSDRETALALVSDTTEVGGVAHEIDPTVPAWAKQPEPPTPEQIGAVANEAMIKISNQEIYDMFKQSRKGEGND